MTVKTRYQTLRVGHFGILITLMLERHQVLSSAWYVQIGMGENGLVRHAYVFGGVEGGRRLHRSRNKILNFSVKLLSYNNSLTKQSE